MTFEDKTVFITGACGGLGKAVVEAFASEGARIAIADLDYLAAQKMSDASTSNTMAVDLDVSSEHAWERAFFSIERELGPVSVLVNNAGYFCPNVTFEEMSLELWRKHFAVNADGTFLGCKYAIRHMKSRKTGSIINIGSGMAIKAVATASAYCASKAAVLMTTRTAAASAGPYGIRVNAVLPGAVPTTMLMRNLVPGQDEDEYLDELSSHSALGRLATPEDIARAVLFLADDSSAAITGVHLPVDSGNILGG